LEEERGGEYMIRSLKGGPFRGVTRWIVPGGRKMKSSGKTTAVFA
jgi:hypothetical protein